MYYYYDCSQAKISSNENMTGFSTFFLILFAFLFTKYFLVQASIADQSVNASYVAKSDFILKLLLVSASLTQ